MTASQVMAAAFTASSSHGFNGGCHAAWRKVREPSRPTMYRRRVCHNVSTSAPEAAITITRITERRGTLRAAAITTPPIANEME